MKKIRLLLICSFILLLFSGNAVATLSPGTYDLGGGTWDLDLTVTPSIINVYGSSGEWSIEDMEQAILQLPSIWISEPGGYYGQVLEIHENGDFLFKLEEGGQDYFTTINGIVKWTLHLDLDGNVLYGDNFIATRTGTLSEDGIDYNIFTTSQDVVELYRDSEGANGTLGSLTLVIFEQVHIDPNPVAVGDSVTLNAVVTNENDIASAWYTLDGGAGVSMDASDGAFDYTDEQVYAMFSVPTPGVYSLCAYAKDNEDLAGPEVCTLLVVYDPDGGFVTGGGWIDSPSGAYKMHYDDIVLNDSQNGNFENIWDITKGDLTLSYTIDLSAQATGGWTPVQAGLRQVGEPNIDPMNSGFMWSSWQNTPTDPNKADIDDHFLLAVNCCPDELNYDVDETGIVLPFGSYSNYAFWFDRDGVDSDQATYWNYKDGITYNTNGIYNVVITYHAVDADTGTMFATINGESQGFYESYSSTDPPDRQPVGRSFSGDMTQMQVFYGRGSGGGIVTLSNFTVAPPIIGQANFGFVSKYKKGATTPDGNTEFVFKAADLNFHSSSYEWLVVTGSDYAKFKGTGTINGAGEYKFQLWAGDGDQDTFRIKIWEEDEYANETVIYDNGMDQYITGGSIVIHTKKK